MPIKLVVFKTVVKLFRSERAAMLSIVFFLTITVQIKMMSVFVCFSLKSAVRVHFAVVSRSVSLSTHQHK